MKHYEARLERDLGAIRTRVAGVGEAVCTAVSQSVTALAAFDSARLYGVILDDHPINRETRAIDQLCHRFVAKHLPAAAPLRFVSSVLRLNIALERIGDYAVTIGRVGVQLSRPLPASVLEDIETLGEKSLNMLRLALEAFNTGNADLARETKLLAKKIDVVHDRVFDNMMGEGTERPLREVVSVLTIFGQLERVSDQAKNICEETVFAATGQTKAPKVYKVMFVDETNSIVSKLAEAMASKAFPESGRFFSAGWAPSATFHPALDRTAEKLGLDIEGDVPAVVESLVQSPASYHVIVLLHEDDSPPLPKIPFHTILLRWTLGDAPSGDDAQFDARLDELAKDIRGRIQELMEILRGEEAL